MIKERLKILKQKFKNLGIDGYIIPKNDEFFSEYSKQDRLKIISNFSGSAGYAVVLKKKNYLFVDGRYTIQAQIESGNNFKIIDYTKIFNCRLFKNLTIGFDAKIFTSQQISSFFSKNSKIKPINKNLIDNIFRKKINLTKPFFSIKKDIAGESHIKKITKISNILKKNKSDYLFVSAPENVAWLLNIRGFDNPNSPIPNCRLLINKNKKIFLISELHKAKNIIKEKKISKKQIINPIKLSNFIKNFKNKKIIIDKKTCSIFFENLLKTKLKILKDDPIYLLKSIKNKNEIQNMVNSHIFDGVALTNFFIGLRM